MKERELKNQKKKGVVLLMALALLGASSLYMSGNTFSSYITEQTASGSAQIAKWDVEFKKGNDTIGKDFTFKLEETKNTNANVNTGVVAPGDTGKIELHVQGPNTEVAYNYSIVLDRSSLNTTMGDAQDHIQFYTDETYKTVWTGNTSVDVSRENAKNDQLVTIYWKWIPEAAPDATDDVKKAWNTADTTAGSKAENAAFTIKLTAKQKTA